MSRTYLPPHTSVRYIQVCTRRPVDRCRRPSCSSARFRCSRTAYIFPVGPETGQTDPCKEKQTFSTNKSSGWLFHLLRTCNVPRRIPGRSCRYNRWDTGTLQCHWRGIQWAGAPQCPTSLSCKKIGNKQINNYSYFIPTLSQIFICDNCTDTCSSGLFPFFFITRTVNFC